MSSDLEQSIFKTVAFFSLFEYPLTAFQIWKWLVKPGVAYALEDVQSALATSDWLKARLTCQDGFFVLTGQERMIATRHQRFLDATRKFKRLRRVGRYLAFLPMVKILAVCNSLAWMNTKVESDIDLFLLTKPGRVWTTRFFAVLPLKLLGLRPKRGAVDPVCLSFFASTEAADLRPLRLRKDDLYLAQWVRSLVPIADRQAFAGFTRVNDWASGIFPNSFAVRPAHPRRFRLTSKRRDLARIVEPFFRRLQRSRLPQELRALANRDTRVVVSDTMLKFHPNDRRQEFCDKLEALCLERS